MESKEDIVSKIEDALIHSLQDSPYNWRKVYRPYPTMATFFAHDYNLINRDITLHVSERDDPRCDRTTSVYLDQPGGITTLSQRMVPVIERFFVDIEKNRLHSQLAEVKKCLDKE